MTPPIICSRCNQYIQTPIECKYGHGQRCEQYLQVMWERFRDNIPPKYYCSLIGGRNSGKTHYLLALLDILLKPDRATKTLLNKSGIDTIDVIDPLSLELHKELLIFCKDGRLGGTLLRTPLGFFNLLITLEDGRTYELVLFNTSGEKIEIEFESRKFSTEAHEMQGAATLFFVDPREDTTLNKMLESPKAGRCLDYDFATHMHKVMQFLNGGVKIVNNPLAVCITKFDLLLHRIRIDLPEHPFVEPHSQNFFRDIERVSRQLKPFLQRHSRTVQPDEIKEQFKAIDYFAVAPFGSDMDPAYWHNREPRGILAPFLWLLNELKIISKEQHGIS